MRLTTQTVLSGLLATAVLGLVCGEARAQIGDQVVTTDFTSMEIEEPGTPVSINFFYTTDPQPCDDTLSGIGLRLHFDDRKLSKQDFTNVFQRDKDLPPPDSNLFIRIVEEPEPDEEDLDEDPRTNSVVRLIWTDIFERSWPGTSCGCTGTGCEAECGTGCLPSLLLFTANFTVLPGFVSNTTVRVTAISTAAGFGFRGADVTLGDPRPFFRRGDHDGSGQVDFTDSLTRLRFLFLGSNPSTCLEASDFDNSGEVDFSDSINELKFLFLGTIVPPAPGVDACGPDPMELVPAGGGLAEQPDVQLGCEQPGVCN